MKRNSPVPIIAWASLACLLATGCSQVGRALPADSSAANVPAPSLDPTDPYAPAIVATVNGHPIEQQTLVDLLTAAYGRKMLDELILTELIRQHARQKDITLTNDLANRELDRLLEEMAPGKPPTEQLALLDYMLQRRKLSRAQFDLIIERETLLRQIVDQRIDITDEMLADEHQRRHGARVQIRQIVVATLREIELANHRLNRGEPFVDVVRDVSQDQRSVTNDGLLAPFARPDDKVPAPVREAAFKLTESQQISPIIHYRDEQSRDHWILLLLERSIAPDGVSFGQARDQLTKTLRKQMIGKRMFDLQQSLRTAADIKILNPDLQPQSAVR